MTSPPDDSSSSLAISVRTRRVAVVVVAALAGAAALFLALNLWLSSGETPDAFASSELGGDDPAGASPEPSVEGTDDPAPGPRSGVWTVQLDAAADAGVGYRIVEDVPVGGPEVVVARTRDVAGEIELDGDVLTSAVAEVALDALASDNSLRDQTVARDYLETATFPTASIRLAEPTKLNVPASPGVVEPISLQVELSLHGVTDTVTVSGGAQWSADVIEIVGSVDISLSRFGVTRPELLGRSARDEAIVELKLQFAPTDSDG